MSTIIENLTAAHEAINDRMPARSGEANREFSLAKTAIEEARMRYTRGRAFEEGVQKDYDFDAQ